MLSFYFKHFLFTVIIIYLEQKSHLDCYHFISNIFCLPGRSLPLPVLPSVLLQVLPWAALAGLAVHSEHGSGDIARSGHTSQTCCSGRHLPSVTRLQIN